MSDPFSQFPFSRGPIEPGSDARQGAASLYENYTAYVQAGFTPPQAMQIVTTILSAVIAAQHGGNPDQ